MGFPAKKLEGVYRNHIDDVVKFLETKHKDHYKIYNLCREKSSYDSAKFCNRVASYPFDDHNPPCLDIFEPFCQDVQSWLTASPENVVAIHCKAGKGRTGVMICAYMLYTGVYKTAAEAMEFYAARRTHDTLGVTIPSQRRYVEYYGVLLSYDHQYQHVPMLLRSIELEEIPSFDIAGSCTPYFAVYVDGQKVYKSQSIDVRKHQKTISFNTLENVVVSGDVRIAFFHKPRKLQKREKMFQFWFNTFFLCPRSNQQDSRLSRQKIKLGASNVGSNYCQSFPIPHSPTVDSKMHSISAPAATSIGDRKGDDGDQSELVAHFSRSFPFVSRHHCYSPYDRSRQSIPADTSALASAFILTNGSLEQSRNTCTNGSAGDSSRVAELKGCHVQTFLKQDLDRAYKDKNCKYFPPSFKVRMFLKCADAPADQSSSSASFRSECPLKCLGDGVANPCSVFEEKSPIARCVPSSTNVAAVIATYAGTSSRNHEGMGSVGTDTEKASSSVSSDETEDSDESEEEFDPGDYYSRDDGSPLCANNTPCSRCRNSGNNSQTCSSGTSGSDQCQAPCGALNIAVGGELNEGGEFGDSKVKQRSQYHHHAAHHHHRASGTMPPLQPPTATGGEDLLFCSQGRSGYKLSPSPHSAHASPSPTKSVLPSGRSGPNRDSSGGCSALSHDAHPKFFHKAVQEAKLCAYTSTGDLGNSARSDRRGSCPR